MTATQTFAPPPPRPLQTGLGRTGRAGAVASLALLAGWSQLVMIDSAVIAPGQVTVHGQPRPVQNLDGGIVQSVHVANGDVVAAGQLLLRLDSTLLQVNLDIYRNRLAEALARKARLEAEQIGLAAPDIAALQASGALRHLAGLSMARHHQGKRQIMAARAEVLRGTSDQLREKIKQLGNRRSGLDGMIAATEEQAALMEAELANMRRLSARGLIRASELMAAERGRADLLGRLASLRSDRARLDNAERDAELQILQAERAFREGVVTDLREVSAEADELILQIVTTRKQLDRVEMRAPAAGVVHELQVTGAGGVVGAGATVLQIVPLDEGLEFELRLDPRMIDQASHGQGVRITFPAFSAQDTPQLHGSVAEISPTSITDPATRTPYYRLMLRIPPAELDRLGARVLVPGMPVEAFLDGHARSAWSYLTRPLADQIQRAFREE